MTVQVKERHLYCDIAEMQFGPEFDSNKDVQLFIDWCFIVKGRDPRCMIEPMHHMKEEWQKTLAKS